MYLLVNQPAGLGDILFGIKLVTYMVLKYKLEKAVGPIADVYLGWFNRVKTKVNIDFVSIDQTGGSYNEKLAFNGVSTSLSEYDEFLYIPLRYSDLAKSTNSVMYVKYDLYNVSFNDGENFFDIERNYDIEMRTYNEMIKNQNNYVFVNDMFGTPPNYIKNSRIVPNHDNVVYNTIVENMFDLRMVLENAAEVHTVETSLCYLLAKGGINNVTVYDKNQKTNFSYINQIYPTTGKYKGTLNE